MARQWPESEDKTNIKGVVQFLNDDKFVTFIVERDNDNNGVKFQAKGYEGAMLEKHLTPFPRQILINLSGKPDYGFDKHIMNSENMLHQGIYKKQSRKKTDLQVSLITWKGFSIYKDVGRNVYVFEFWNDDGVKKSNEFPITRHGISVNIICGPLLPKGG